MSNVVYLAGTAPNEEDTPRGWRQAMRALTAALVGRARLGGGGLASTTFHGKRHLYEALGYPQRITLQEYRAMFHRNAVAGRIVESKPQATWRAGGEVIEDEDPDVETTFETAWRELDERLRIWSVFSRADVLAGMGHYSVILIGAPGKLEEPLEKLNGGPLYLQPFAEDDARIDQYDLNTESERYGQPLYYALARLTNLSTTSDRLPIPTSATLSGKRCHFSRVLHVPSDCALDDLVFGLPRLERVWNLLLDLEKVTGGGAEAFWKRADPGMQLELNPDVDFTPADEDKLDADLDAYTHGLKRILKTRGIDVNPLTSQVADFRGPASAIFDQLSAGTGIPQRILMGSERGELASSQDTEAWYERITDRRNEFARSFVVRPFVDKLVLLGALPKPAHYDVRWPEMRNLSDSQRAEVATKWSLLNRNANQVVVTAGEIRDRVLGLPALTDAQVAEATAQAQATVQPGATSDQTGAEQIATEVTPTVAARARSAHRRFDEHRFAEKLGDAILRRVSENKRERAEEVIRAVRARLGNTGAADANIELILESEGLLRTAEFNADQPRDEHGQWTGGGDGGAVTGEVSYESKDLLFHGTSSEALALIKEQGLVPGGGKGATIGGTQTVVMMTGDLSSAKQYAHYATQANPGSKPVLLVIKPPKGDVKLTKNKLNRQIIETKQTIKPEWIHVADVFGEGPSMKTRALSGSNGGQEDDVELSEFYAFFIVTGDDVATTA